MAQALGTVRSCFMPMAGLDASVPIWITENGIPTGANTTEAQQADGLTQLVDAARDYSGTFNVTDYRWFNLRDSNSSQPPARCPARPRPSPPTACCTTTTRPSRPSRPTATRSPASVNPPPHRRSCAAVRPEFRIALPHERRAIRRANVYRGTRRVGHASGRRLRRVVVRRPGTGRFRCASCCGCAAVNGSWCAPLRRDRLPADRRTHAPLSSGRGGV